MDTQFGINLMDLTSDNNCDMEAEFFGGSGGAGGCGGSGGWRWRMQRRKRRLRRKWWQRYHPGRARGLIHNYTRASALANAGARFNRRSRNENSKDIQLRNP